MEKLTYLSTFLSLILGLGVANVLAQLSALVKRGRKTDWYLLHTLWAVFVLLLMAGEWWIIQLWESVPRISFFTYLFLLGKPCLLFLMSDLLFPDRSDTGAVDMKQYFYGIHSRFFVVLALYPVIDLVDTLLKGVEHLLSLGPIYLFVILTTAAAALVASKTRSERIHYVVLVWIYVLVGVSMINALGSVA